jgi:hypothetical protein
LAIDTAPSGRLTFNLFASIAQFERENMLERQKVGIAAAKKRDTYVGPCSDGAGKECQGPFPSCEGNDQAGDRDACSIGIASVYRILVAAA